MATVTIGFELDFPENFLDEKELARNIDKALKEVGEIGRSKFEQATRHISMSVPPLEKLSDGYGIGVNDGGTGNWVRINRGTKGHFVEPKNGPFLSWIPTTASTQPGTFASKPVRVTGPRAYSTGHFVSGIEPRNLDILLREELQPILVAAIIRAFTKSFS